jgi:NAD(P)-dependent dehydrogenase (short-subunit alcohol dehydrogenase family)
MGLSQKKIALVTGANKGLGFEISRQLAQQGITVVMAARDRAKGQVAVRQLLQVGLDVEFQYLDVTDIESIKVGL